MALRIDGPRSPLSLARCRAALGSGADLGDSELKQLRDRLYDLAAVVVDHARPRCDGTRDPFRQALALLPEERRDEAEERAAILEYEAGQTRSDAERAAITTQIQKAWKRPSEN